MTAVVDHEHHNLILSHHQPFLLLQVIGQQEESLFHTISFPKLLLIKNNCFLPLQLGDRINKPLFSSYDPLSNTTPALYFPLNSLSTSSWLKFCFSRHHSDPSSSYLNNETPLFLLSQVLVGSLYDPSNILETSQARPSLLYASQGQQHLENGNSEIIRP